MPSVLLDIPADHPAFAGHFPGQPIVPGVVLLDHTLLAIEANTGLQLAGLATAKFLSPALPGELLGLQIEVTESGVRFDILCEGRKVATGRFTVAPGTSK